MKKIKINSISQLNYIILILVMIFSCSSEKNSERVDIPVENNGCFHTTKDGLKIYIYEYQPIEDYNSVIFLISGITGINHTLEKETIEQLSNNENKVIVIHPRGTGYSEGKRGDISDFSYFISDYIEIITNNKDYYDKSKKIILFGHSMSTAILLAVADKLDDISGVILVNPPYILKNAKGMSPNLSQYIKFIWYYLFDKHTPVVNMAGDPALIENEDDRKESELRYNDRLLVKYFSMYMMIESKKIMDSMILYSKKANYPLLLIYGEKDSIVDKKGCDLIFDSWKSEKKEYILIPNGTHGSSTVIKSKEAIINWINNL